MTEELKPCPFCGEEVLFDHDDEWEWIVCPSCGASTNRRVSLMEDCKPLLAEQWNRRASGWQTMESAPKDGSRILLRTVIFHWSSDVCQYVAVGHKAVEGFWGGCMSGKEGWREWCGSVKSHSTDTLVPTRWMPLPEPSSIVNGGL